MRRFVRKVPLYDKVWATANTQASRTYVQTDARPTTNLSIVKIGAGVALTFGKLVCAIQLIDTVSSTDTVKGTENDTTRGTANGTTQQKKQASKVLCSYAQINQL